ncbi:MAG TPA: DUF3299 domain-containing protein [Caldimonas sp.]|jgi:hypothetical protein|nr:DUF3299 domain-containing protein [Caldimonas sp.]HEX2540307.1 DUF3299 domain-containing protein [Caldimonas sp.]
MKTRPSPRPASPLIGFLSVGAALLVGVAAVALAPVLPSAAQAAAPGAEPFREIKWDELIPKDWDPFKGFRLRELGAVNDADPRAGQMLKDMRAVLDNAPVVPALDGARVKLPGYVVPLDEAAGELKEFLLVPYFGACIHTPPPPANQIVFVVAPKGTKFRAMDTVWVSGTLRATRQESTMGASGYRIDAAVVAAYTGPPR